MKFYIPFLLTKFSYMNFQPNNKTTDGLMIEDVAAPIDVH